MARFRQRSSNPSWDVVRAVSIGEIAGKMISMLAERARRAKLHIIVKDMSNLAKININETILEQVFFNIIQNAIEAADGKKTHTLTINARSENNRIELEFSDDCGGIAPQELEKIFEPFFTTKSPEKAMGLGLEIVRRVLMGVDGDINVESKPGSGTIFYVKLPANDGADL